MAAIAAIGMFDGVHQGHRSILDALSREAAASGREAIAFTFAVHPRETLTGRHTKLITTLDQKLALIEQYARPETLDFTKADFALSTVEFLEKLRSEYGVEALVMGYNNHIGSDRRDASWVRDNAGIEVLEVPRHDHEGATPSSSRIRELIEQGDIGSARMLLGHEFSVRGKVVAGRQIGRTIGFPTANIEPSDSRQLLPADGVYAVDVLVDGAKWRGMANIGTRPTVSDGRGRTLEVNIFDFDADIYNKAVEVIFLSRLRPEKAFDSLEELREQLERDKIEAKSAYFGKRGHRSREV